MNIISYCMHMIQIIVLLFVINMFCMEIEEDASNKKIFDITYDLCTRLKNYDYYTKNRKEGYDPVTILHTFTFSNTHTNEKIKIGPNNKKRIIMYATFVKALKNCIKNNIVTYENILSEIDTLVIPQE